MATIEIKDVELQQLIRTKVAEYGYADASSYVRDLIRRDEARAQWLRDELQKGLDSGISPYSFEEIVERAFERVRRKCA